MLIATTHSSHHASPTVSASAMQTVIKKVPCKPGPTHLVCERPWSEAPPFPIDWSRPPATHAPETTFHESVDIGFFPGDKRRIVDLSVPTPAGKRLFYRSLQLISNLPTGQHAAVASGSTLTFDSTGKAPLGLYGDKTTALKVQVTRDADAGSGLVTLVVEGSFVNALQQRK